MGAPAGFGENMKNHRGFSLLELLIVVVLIGTIAGFGVPRLIQAHQEAEAEAFVQDLVSWGDRLDQARPNGLDFGGMTNQMVYELAPPNWKAGNVNGAFLIRDTYSGNVTYGVTTMGMGGFNAAANFNTSAVPRSMCSRILRMAQARFPGIWVNGTWIKMAWNNQIPAPNTFITSCSNTNNSITWTII